ncbi:hypothetical protein [Salinadaptatus halalkaliphilus]|uniref:hypothetical protein n=1 Tax=Salinadaptatus halalkaliphilus TaxID=2419781 RepID=UPI001142FDBE|nr:hypothetical protein [Salinadaptatus halalkaliphilus]
MPADDRFDGSDNRRRGRTDQQSRRTTQLPQDHGPTRSNHAQANDRSRSGGERIDIPFPDESLRYEADVDRVVERLYRKLERRERIERERRGKQ